MNIADLLCAGSSTPNRDEPFQWDPNSGISTFSIMPLSTPPRKKRGKYTTRDQRRDIKMVYRCGKQIPDIAAMLNIIAKRVAYALDNEALTPKK
jgi:hypothetical protein